MAAAALPATARSLRHLHTVAYIFPQHPHALDIPMPVTKRPSDNTRTLSRPLPAPKRKVEIDRDAGLIASWAEEFDAKLAKLTQRQDAFLASLERRSAQVS